MRVKITTPDGSVTFQPLCEQEPTRDGDILPLSFETMLGYPPGTRFEVEEFGARCPRCHQWKPKGSMRICCM